MWLSDQFWQRFPGQFPLYNDKTFTILQFILQVCMSQVSVAMSVCERVSVQGRTLVVSWLPGNPPQREGLIKIVLQLRPLIIRK